MKLGTHRNPKFADLQARTELSVPMTIGTLELLWQFAMEQAPQGDVGKWPNDAIERACYWLGTPGLLVDSLLNSGWLDECDERRLVVHDWIDHAPEYLKKRLSRQGLAPVAAIRTPNGSQTDAHQAMPSHAGPGQAKSNTPDVSVSAGGKKKTTKARATDWPEAGLNLEQKLALSKSDSMKDITPSQFQHACDRVRDWAAANGKMRVDWVATVRNAITAGWGLEGYGGDSKNPKGSGRGSGGYVPPPAVFSKPEGHTLAADLTDEQLEKARKDTAAVRQKLTRGGQNGACGDIPTEVPLSTSTAH